MLTRECLSGKLELPARGVRSKSRFVATFDVVEATFMWAFSTNTKATSNPPVAVNKPSAIKKERRTLFSILALADSLEST